MKKSLFLSVLIVLSQAFVFAETSTKNALALVGSDLRLEAETSGASVTGYHLYIRKKAGLESVMLTESAKDPNGKKDNYALRAYEYNSINGDEIRYLNGKKLESVHARFSLIDSTSQKDKVFGEAFHIYIPLKVRFGYPWARNGEIEMKDGVVLNIRTFSKKYCDYTGGFSDTSFVLDLSGKSKAASSSSNASAASDSESRAEIERLKKLLNESEEARKKAETELSKVSGTNASGESSTLTSKATSEKSASSNIASETSSTSESSSVKTENSGSSEITKSSSSEKAFEAPEPDVGNAKEYVVNIFTEDEDSSSEPLGDEYYNKKANESFDEISGGTLHSKGPETIVSDIMSLVGKMGNEEESSISGDGSSLNENASSGSAGSALDRGGSSGSDGTSSEKENTSSAEENVSSSDELTSVSDVSSDASSLEENKSSSESSVSEGGFSESDGTTSESEDGTSDSAISENEGSVSETEDGSSEKVGTSFAEATVSEKDSAVTESLGDSTLTNTASESEDGSASGSSSSAGGAISENDGSSASGTASENADGSSGAGTTSGNADASSAGSASSERDGSSSEAGTASESGDASSASAGSSSEKAEGSSPEGGSSSEKDGTSSESSDPDANIQNPGPVPSGELSIERDYSEEAGKRFLEVSQNLTYSKGPETIVDDVVKSFDAESAGKGKADLVFVIDATGSMIDDIEQLRSTLVPQLNQMKSKFEVFRVGLVLYRDYGDDFSYYGLPVKYYDFTDDLEKFSANLNDFVITGSEGGDIPEAVYEGLYAGLALYVWDKDAYKKIILIGDAEPHPKPRMTKRYTKQLVQKLAKDKGVKIDAIITPDGRIHNGE